MQRQNPEFDLQTLSLRKFSIEEGGLNIEWSDGHRSFFHALWLRDCCYCEKCGDSYSSKRYLMPSDIPLDIRARDAAAGADGFISITWDNDGHVSSYDPAWLRRHCYDESARASRFHEPALWDSAIGEALPEVSFEAAQKDDHARLDLYRKLRDYGFVVVTGGPRVAGDIEAVANLIGDLGESAYTRIFDLTPSSRVSTMGNTSKAVPPHTDEAFRYAPPGINILGCVRPAADGGDTVLVDGFFAAESLRRFDESMYELLCSYNQVFNRIHPGKLDQRSRSRMIERDDRGRVVGIRFHTRAAGPLDLPADRVKPYYAAHRRFCELVSAPENQLCFRLETGDSVMFDNHRVLHARTEFSDGQRHLQICNVARETYHERLRLLAASLGLYDEADMVLAAGVC